MCITGSARLHYRFFGYINSHIVPVQVQEHRAVCVQAQGQTTIQLASILGKLFTKKQSQDENLPPTKGTLHPVLVRAHLQALHWNQDVVQHPVIPPPHG